MSLYDECGTATGVVRPGAERHETSLKKRDRSRGGQSRGAISCLARVEDYAYLMEICRGDKQAVAGLLEIFIHAARMDLVAWKAACNEDNWAAARKLSHKLRSGFHQLGEIGISRRLAEIETGGGDSETGQALPDLCRQLLPQIHSAMAKAEWCARGARRQ